MDQDLERRIEKGRTLVLGEVAFFRAQFASVESHWKEDRSRVTAADLAISARITQALAKAFPGDDACSEETDPSEAPRTLSARFAWFLDPVDGTNNFALGMPSCAISLGIVENGVPAYGFIYDFGRDRLIEGGPGLGILDGGKPVKGLLERPLEGNSIIGMAFPLKGPNAEGLHGLAGTFNIRSLGSGALSLVYVALGILDGCIDMRSKSWDVAAALAILAATEGEIRYLGTPHFPLATFDVHQPSRPFYAGTEAFRAACEKIFGRAG